jgi:hypothetical protein
MGKPLLQYLRSSAQSDLPSSATAHARSLSQSSFPLVSALYASAHPTRRQVRVLLSTLLSLVAILQTYLYLTLSMHPFAVEDRQGRCEFVSPVDAYYRRATTSTVDGGAPDPARLRWKEDGELENDVHGLEGQGAQGHPVLKLLERGEIQWDNLRRAEPKTFRSVHSSCDGRKTPAD